MGNNMKSVLFILLALAISKSLAGHLITDCGGIVDLYEEHSCRTVPGNTQLDNEGGSNTPVATCDDVRQVYVDNTCCADNPHKHLSDQSKLYEWCMTDTIHPVLTHSGPATTTLTLYRFSRVGSWTRVHQGRTPSRTTVLTRLTTVLPRSLAWLLWNVVRAKWYKMVHACLTVTAKYVDPYVLPEKYWIQMA